MEENLVGYLFKCLDADTQRAMDDYVRTHPEVVKRLAALRRALAPLAADRADLEPPPGLWLRTLAHIAEHRCRDLPQAPTLPVQRAAPPPRRWWTRRDALVAAGLLLCAGLLVPPGLNHMRRQQEITSCQNNLRVMGQGLLTYASLEQDPEDPRHQRGAFPNVAHHPPHRSVAGIFVPHLIDTGVLSPEQVSVRCAANGAPVASPWRLRDLKALTPAEFEQRAADLVPCYAYSLGYRDPTGQIQGLRSDTGLEPIVADRPPACVTLNGCEQPNSLNHDGKGQNILFTDGHVGFHTTRQWRADDIFLNGDKKPAAGLRKGDTVLGASETRPRPAPAWRD